MSPARSLLGILFLALVAVLRGANGTDYHGFGEHHGYGDHSHLHDDHRRFGERRFGDHVDRSDDTAELESEDLTSLEKKLLEILQQHKTEAKKETLTKHQNPALRLPDSVLARMAEDENIKYHLDKIDERITKLAVLYDGEGHDMVKERHPRSEGSVPQQQDDVVGINKKLRKALTPHLKKFLRMVMKEVMKLASNKDFEAEDRIDSHRSHHPEFSARQGFFDEREARNPGYFDERTARARPGYFDERTARGRFIDESTEVRELNDGSDGVDLFQLIANLF